MNLPFSFSLTSTNIYGLFWNPWETVVANSVANTVLSALAADLQERYGLLITSGMSAILTGFSATCDTAGGEIQLGIWDADRAVFDVLYPALYPLKVVDGQYQRRFAGSGLCLPVSATQIPACKLVGNAATVIVTGDLDLVLTREFGNSAGPATPVPSSNLLADDNTTLLTESGLPLRTG